MHGADSERCRDVKQVCGSCPERPIQDREGPGPGAAAIADDDALRRNPLAADVPSACSPVQAGTDHDIYRTADAERLGMGETPLQRPGSKVASAGHAIA